MDDPEIAWVRAPPGMQLTPNIQGDLFNILDPTNPSEIIHSQSNLTNQGITYSETPYTAVPPPLPIHLRKHTPHLQPLCPFYSGIIPAEIRNIIFKYVFTPTSIPGTEYDPNTLYTRPGTTCRTLLHTSFLQTCRRIYLETWHLPPTSITHVLWYERRPPSPKSFTTEQDYFARIPSFQLELVTHIHLHTQAWWLEGSLGRLLGEPFLRNITSLKITLRRGDWWYYEDNHPLVINPYSGRSSDGEMHRVIERCQQGKMVNWIGHKWGCAMMRLPKLEVFEMEFETSEDKREELRDIVEWATTWEFPLDERGVLSTRSAEDLRRGRVEEDWGRGMRDVKTWEWKGKRVHWSEICPYCTGNDCSRPGGPGPAEGKDGDKCRERAELWAKEEGPMLVVMEVKWRRMLAGAGRISGLNLDSEESDDEEEW